MLGEEKEKRVMAIGVCAKLFWKAQSIELRKAINKVRIDYIKSLENERGDCQARTTRV